MDNNEHAKNIASKILSANDLFKSILDSSHSLINSDDKLSAEQKEKLTTELNKSEKDMQDKMDLFRKKVSGI